MVIKIKFLILFLVLILGGYLLSLRELREVREISCKTQYGPCRSEEQEKLRQFVGEDIIFFNSTDVKEIFSGDFRTRDVYVQRVFPGKLNVFLEKRKPFMGVRLEGFKDEGVFLIDREGVVLEFTRESPLPEVITKEEKIIVGERLTDGILAATKVVFLAHKLELVDKVTGMIEGNTVVIDLGGTKVDLPLDKDPGVLIGALQLIMTRSRIDGKLPRSIDLRYSNPVLSF